MTAAAEAVLAELALPGRTLAFCDETDLTTGATSAMVGDIHAWVAVILPSASYPALESAVLGYQAAHGVPEFHGTEIVNPKSGTHWHAVPPGARIETYRFACEVVAAHASELRYSYISAGQYAELLAAHPGSGAPASHKDGVKAVFRTSIVSHLAGQPPPLLVIDKDKNTPGATLEPLSGCDHLVGGGIVKAASHTVAGLQLADVAAYAVGRYLRRRDAIIAEQANVVDAISMEMLAELSGRFLYLD